MAGVLYPGTFALQSSIEFNQELRYTGNDFPSIASIFAFEHVLFYTLHNKKVYNYVDWIFLIWLISLNVSYVCEKGGGGLSFELALHAFCWVNDVLVISIQQCTSVPIAYLIHIKV